MMNRQVKWMLLVSTLALVGCAGIPDKLVVADEYSLTPYRQLDGATPAIYGQEARWGGVIAAINVKESTTELEVVNFPLSSSTRPQKDKETLGRFKLTFTGLLDPMVYKVGRSITALGTLSGVESGKIGEFPYQFPVLQANYVHLWKDVNKIDMRVRQDPYWYNSGFWPYYPPYYYRPYPRTVVVSGESKIHLPPRNISKTAEK
ncbi:Slp family lipoprotein [Thalassotalea agarivorans]|uniref:Outer membrane lipoprotein n=1 Tax=Thalassotalea agarivorans TaxID=349064 RepID=A0A1I0DHY3_THASX|nr:Slp family lipoprotein [Thalassotalea agarivorans]SET31654.1 outer membrane lipoprotein [Thalassotalea agarivorans]